MNHATAMRDNTSVAVTCAGALIDANDSFSSDINWTVYTCEKCLATVFTVGGGVHWWNHHGIPSESRKVKQDAMRNPTPAQPAGAK